VVLAPAASHASSCGGYSGGFNGSSCESDLQTKAYPSAHSVKVGHRLFLLVVVTNNGPDPAVGEVKTVNLTSGALTVDWALTSGGYCDQFAKPPLEDCVLAYDLPAGSSVALSLVMVPKRAGTFINRTSSTSLSDDPNPSNNVAKTTITVTP